MAKILPEAKQIAVEFQPEQEAKAMQLRSALNEQLLLLEPLDKEILTLMQDDDQARIQDFVWLMHQYIILA